MRLATIRVQDDERAAVLHGDRLFPIDWINRDAGRSDATDLLTLLNRGQLDGLRRWYDGEGRAWLDRSTDAGIPIGDVHFAPLYRRPRKIWGIGLNYRDHAADLDESSPTAEPASFMKPDTTVVGPGDTILLPRLSQRVTGEGELALVFARVCRDVPRDHWTDALAGFTTAVDMTAEDILRRNPRNLTQCKSFDTFFSFGPVLVTPDEIDDVMNLSVRTVHNNRLHAENTVSHMTFPPDFLVWYHTQIMTMLPGDVLSTGTPGAAPLADGDTIACDIDGFPTLVNPVRDLKLEAVGAP